MENIEPNEENVKNAKAAGGGDGSSLVLKPRPHGITQRPSHYMSLKAREEKIKVELESRCETCSGAQRDRHSILYVLAGYRLFKNNTVPYSV